MIETTEQSVRAAKSQAVAVTSSGVASSSGYVHLGYLDGIRGCAALYVVLRHTYMEVDWRYTEQGAHSVLPHILTLLFRATQYTHFAVGVFIVLSGYCLMLPVARREDGNLSGGTREYLRRRARRILPPYYAALFCALLLFLLIPAMRRPNGTRWDLYLPQLTFGSIVSHLLLIHNLHPHWVHTIDGPMWSVGMEWQIYFIFPAVLLPVWRRWGNLAAMMVAVLIGVAPHFLLHRLDPTCPWYIGLFAFGMCAAVINFSSRAFYMELSKRVRWDWIGAVIVCAAVAVATKRPGWMWARGYYLDSALGAGAACLLVHLTRCVQSGRRSLPIRFLQHPAIFSLGVFSYSLYLVHAPLLEATHLFLMRFSLSPLKMEAILYIVFVPCCIGVAYLFHRVFERPFMRQRVNR